MADRINPDATLRTIKRVLVAIGGTVGFLAAGATIWAFLGPTPAQKSEPYVMPSPTSSVTEVDSPEDSAVDDSYSGGWGPDRETFTGERPAEYAVLNSITDNPAVGDERNFVRVRLDGTSYDYGDFVRADVGDRVQVLVSVFNDAADNLDGPAATIHGLRAEFWWPSEGTDLPIGVALSGKNATEVWDGATIITHTPAILKVVRDSAYMYTNFGTFSVPIEGDYVDSLRLGWSAPDGEFPVGYSTDGKYRGNGYLQLILEVAAAEQ